VKRAFLTANAPQVGAFLYKMVVLPQSSEFVHLLVGAMVALTESANYEQFGDLSPDEMAEYFNVVLESMRDVPMEAVGTFVESLRVTAPPNWIACYGQDEAMADWPELMEVYPLQPFGNCQSASAGRAGTQQLPRQFAP